MLYDITWFGSVYA